MTTNYDVAISFMQQKPKKTLNLKSTGQELISYNTVIARHIGNLIIKSSNTFSQTTAKHLSNVYGKNVIQLPFTCDSSNTINEIISNTIKALCNDDININKAKERRAYMNFFENAEIAYKNLPEFEVLKLTLKLNRELYNICLDKELKLATRKVVA